MCNNSLIYLATPTTASVTSGGTMPLTTIVRRRGRSINAESDNIILSAPGYYKVTATATFTAPAPGTVSLEIRKDGLAIQGLTASTTITTATTEIRSLTISGIVRVMCCGGAETLTIINTGEAIDVSNITFDVEYLD